MFLCELMSSKYECFTNQWSSGKVVKCISFGFCPSYSLKLSSLFVIIFVQGKDKTEKKKSK